MEYGKEDLIKESIKRIEALDETLKSCQELISEACAERQVVRYLLWLSCEKEVK